MKVSESIFDYASNLPYLTVESLRGYLLKGIPPSGFLRAVLNNDLTIAILRADEDNQLALRAIVKFLHNHAPPMSWGHPNAVRDWLEAYRRAA